MTCHDHLSNSHSFVRSPVQLVKFLYLIMLSQLINPSKSNLHFFVSVYTPLAALSPLLSCQQIYLSQSCLHFCHVSRSTSRSPVSTFVMSADPPLAVLSPLLSSTSRSPVSTFVVHLSQSCLHFCRPPLAVLSPLWSSTSRSPDSTFVISEDPPCLHFCRVTSRSPASTFVMSANAPLAVLSPLLSCQQIHLSHSCLHISRSTSRSPVSTFVVSADPPLAVLSPLMSCLQIHLSQSCLHFCRPHLTVLSPLLSHQQIHLLQSCLHFCRVSRFTSRSTSPVSALVTSIDSPPAVLSPLLSCQ